VRLRILQALALAGALYAVGPIAAPAQIGLDELDLHYGETVRLAGRVTEITNAGEFTRVTLADGQDEAHVLLRGGVPPLGAKVQLTGQPTPDETGPIVWADGAIERVDAPASPSQPKPLAPVLDEAPTLAPAPISVQGRFDPNASTLTGPAGQLPVEPRGIQPPAEHLVLWGRLVYEADDAAYQLEATGWRTWPAAS
jgi:hypothetical protein